MLTDVPDYTERGRCSEAQILFFLKDLESRYSCLEKVFQKLLLATGISYLSSFRKPVHVAN
jgi:hypothetical protein